MFALSCLLRVECAKTLIWEDNLRVFYACQLPGICCCLVCYGSHAVVVPCSRLQACKLRCSIVASSHGDGACVYADSAILCCIERCSSQNDFTGLEKLRPDDSTGATGGTYKRANAHWCHRRATFLFFVGTLSDQLILLYSSMVYSSR